MIQGEAERILVARRLDAIAGALDMLAAELGGKQAEKIRAIAGDLRREAGAVATGGFDGRL